MRGEASASDGSVRKHSHDCGRATYLRTTLRVQQRGLLLRLTITRVLFGASSVAIAPMLSASLMAVRTLALPTLARLAIWATDRVHPPKGATHFQFITLASKLDFENKSYKSKSFSSEKFVT